MPNAHAHVPLNQVSAALDEKQAIIELYGRLLADLFPDVRASGAPLEHAQKIVVEIRQRMNERRYENAVMATNADASCGEAHPFNGPEMVPVDVKDLRAGDRVWCRLWQHPLLVVLRDEDADGPWFKVQRSDGMVISGRFRFRDVARTTGQLYRMNSGATCPRCGRAGEQHARPATATAKAFRSKEGGVVVDVKLAGQSLGFVRLEDLKKASKAFEARVKKELKRLADDIARDLALRR